jgi:hypothetical protein
VAYQDHFIVRVKWTEEWSVGTSFDGQVIQTHPEKVGGNSEELVGWYTAQECLLL